MTTWMTRQEAAEYLKLSKPTIDRMVRTGKLRKYRAGQRGVRFLKSDLDAAIQGAGINQPPLKDGTPRGNWNAVFNFKCDHGHVEVAAQELGLTFDDTLDLMARCSHKEWHWDDRVQLMYCAECQMSNHLAYSLGVVVDMPCGHSGKPEWSGQDFSFHFWRTDNGFVCREQHGDQG